MTVLSLILLGLMIPLSVVAARSGAWRAPSPLRRCCTVLYALTVYGMMLYFLESAGASLTLYGQDGTYLQGLATALIALFWATAVAAGLLGRYRAARIAGVLVIVLAHAGAGLLLSLRHSGDLAFTTPVVEISAAVCLLTWCNLLTTFEKKGRRAVSLVLNVVMFALTLIAAVWALRQGAAVLEQTGGSSGALVLTGVIGAALLAPGAVCAGSCIRDAVREAYGEDDEEEEGAE